MFSGLHLFRRFPHGLQKDTNVEHHEVWRFEIYLGRI